MSMHMCVETPQLGEWLWDKGMYSRKHKIRVQRSWKYKKRKRPETHQPDTWPATDSHAVAL